MTETDSIPLRVCTKCKKAQPHSEYHKTKATVIGLVSRCRTCCAMYFAENRDSVNRASLARYHRITAPKKEEKSKARQARIDAPDKKCSGCKAVKPKTEFADSKGTLDGKRAYCRPCKALESKKYRKKNPEKSREASDRWIRNNIGRRRETMKHYQRRLSNRLHHTFSSRMYGWVKNKKGMRTKQIIDYGWQELKVHLEKQFLPGMTWENYGEWEIDHIIPLSKFKIADVHDPQVKRAWCLTNLRPLWASDNRKKNAKVLFLI